MELEDEDDEHRSGLGMHYRGLWLPRDLMYATEDGLILIAETDETEEEEEEEEEAQAAEEAEEEKTADDGIWWDEDYPPEVAAAEAQEDRAAALALHQQVRELYPWIDDGLDDAFQGDFGLGPHVHSSGTCSS